jgi:hypothetical protein
MTVHSDEVRCPTSGGLCLAYRLSANRKRLRRVTQDTVDVLFFAREVGFAERRLRSPDDSIELASLGISLPLSTIYRATGFG